MSGQRLRCDVCGWTCEGEKGMTLEDAHPDCPGPRAPHPPAGDSSVAAALHVQLEDTMGAPQTLYERIEGYTPAPDPWMGTPKADLDSALGAHEAPPSDPRVPDAVVLSLAALDAQRPTMLVDELYNTAISLAREVALRRGLALCGAEARPRQQPLWRVHRLPGLVPRTAPGRPPAARLGGGMEHLVRLGTRLHRQSSSRSPGSPSGDGPSPLRPPAAPPSTTLGTPSSNSHLRATHQRILHEMRGQEALPTPSTPLDDPQEALTPGGSRR